MATKTVYLFDGLTKEYTQPYEAQESPEEPGEFIIPINHVKEKPIFRKNEVAVAEDGKWVIYPDFRGTIYFSKEGEGIEITERNIIVPVGYPTHPPPSDIFTPNWNGTMWVETSIIFHGVKVESKNDVDAITKQLIIDLGEEKAKSEAIDAIFNSKGVPSIWTSFINAKDAIIKESEKFIKDNNLI